MSQFGCQFQDEWGNTVQDTNGNDVTDSNQIWKNMQNEKNTQERKKKF